MQVRGGHCLFIVVTVIDFFVSTHSAPGTNFSFPSFPASTDFIIFGETRYNPGTRSFTINPTQSLRDLDSQTLFCVKMFYREKVRMKTASFRTAFTFSITQRDESVTRSGWLGYSYGFMFTFGSEDHFSLFSRKSDVSAMVKDLKYVAVEIDTYNDFLSEDPSDNHIGVNVNDIRSAYMYNLCEGNRTSCSFPWTGRTYTAWIDYDAATKSLEVWFANGSLREGITKPAGAGMIHVPYLDLTDIFEEFMYVGFSGNVWPFLDTHEIISWNFATTETEPSRAILSKREIYVMAIVSTLAALSLLGCWRIRQGFVSEESPGFEVDNVTRYSYKELKRATKNFSESGLLGKGAFGSVYKGILAQSGIVVAVKKLERSALVKEFQAEVSTISQVRHRNLVHLRGWCHERGQFLLVFDYMCNGSLDAWVCRSEALPWEVRFSVLSGVAAAVEWIQCVLHRDIKSSNVMLDVDFSPRLGDFGPPRLVSHEKVEKTTVMAGTFGYIAPEIHYTEKATNESDVYSFGILMLEVLCGRKPVDFQSEVNILLVQDVWEAHEDGDILRAVDAGLLSNLPLETEPFDCMTISDNVKPAVRG